MLGIRAKIQIFRNLDRTDLILLRCSFGDAPATLGPTPLIMHITQYLCDYLRLYLRM